MTEFPYDASYEPALPVCEVILSVAAREDRLHLPAVIDTGADITLVPLRHLQQLGARRSLEASLRSQWGERRVVYLYLVNVQVDDVVLPGTFVVGDDLGNEVILGRDVLNRLCMELDGPARVTRMIVQ